MVRQTMNHTPPKRLSEKQAAGLALKRLRKRADLTQEVAAAQAGVATQSWRRYEWGERDLSLDSLARLAAAIGFTLADVLAERERVKGGLSTLDAPPTGGSVDLARLTPHPRIPALQLLPIRDPVQAGTWHEVDGLDQQAPAMSTTLRDPRYPHADQWLAPVRGPSVNRLGINDGDYVHCVDTVQIGYEPETGHIVEVERVRFQGRERELTLKQVEIVGDEVLLWPRSTDDRYQQPLMIHDGIADHEDFEVRIRGLVIASIRRY